MQTLNLKPGPLIGQLLERIREAQDEGKVVSKGDALRLVKKYLKTKNLVV